MEIGDIYSATLIVTEEMAASRAVDGVPHVFGTPYLVGFMEETAHKALLDDFEVGETSVGLALNLEHSSPTPIGMNVRCDVKLVERNGILVDFEINAFDDAGSICSCTHRRAIVQRERIEAKAEKKFRESTVM